MVSKNGVSQTASKMELNISNIFMNGFCVVVVNYILCSSTRLGCFYSEK